MLVSQSIIGLGAGLLGKGKISLIISLAALTYLSEGQHKPMLEVQSEKETGLEEKARADANAKASPQSPSAPSRTLDSSNHVRNQMVEMERKIQQVTY